MLTLGEPPMISKMTLSRNEVCFVNPLEQIHILIFRKTLAWERVPQIDDSWKKGLLVETKALCLDIHYKSNTT